MHVDTTVEELVPLRIHWNDFELEVAIKLIQIYDLVGEGEEEGEGFMEAPYRDGKVLLAWVRERKIREKWDDYLLNPTHLIKAREVLGKLGARAFLTMQASQNSVTGSHEMLLWIDSVRIKKYLSDYKIKMEPLSIDLDAAMGGYDDGPIRIGSNNEDEKPDYRESLPDRIVGRRKKIPKRVIYHNSPSGRLSTGNRGKPSDRERELLLPGLADPLVSKLLNMANILTHKEKLLAVLFQFGPEGTDRRSLRKLLKQDSKKLGFPYPSFSAILRDAQIPTQLGELVEVVEASDCEDDIIRPVMTLETFARKYCLITESAESDQSGSVENSLFDCIMWIFQPTK